MKNKKQILIISILCFTCAIGAYAASEVITEKGNKEIEMQQDSMTAEDNLVIGNISKDKIEGIGTQKDIEAYTHFLAELYPTKEEIEYIDTLLGKGYSAKPLVEIFEFWQDTQEDINIIEEVYAYRPPVDDVLFWVDEAFIQLASQGKTQGQYSDLSVEEVQAYYESGISYEEILVADRLSRYGTKEIKTILSQRQAEASWYEIMDSVYSLSKEESREADIQKYSVIKNPNEIFASIKLAEQNEMSLSAALDGVVSENSSVALLSQKNEVKKQEIKSGFIEQGLWRESTEEA